MKNNILSPNILSPSLIYALIMIGIGLISMFNLHPWNFTAMGAAICSIGLLKYNLQIKFGITLAILVFANYVMGYEHSILVYLSYLGYFAAGIFTSFRPTILRGVGNAFLGGLFFYLFSNFGVWIAGNLYPLNIAGLVLCYQMAIPFAANQFTADLIFSGLSMASYVYFVKSPSMQKSSSKIVLN